MRVLRGGAVCQAMVGLAIYTVMAYSEHNVFEDAVGGGIATAVCGVLFALVMIYPRRRMPSYARACTLAQHAQLNERGWAALNVLYGRDPLEMPGATDLFSASPADRDR